MVRSEIQGLAVAQRGSRSGDRAYGGRAIRHDLRDGSRGGFEAAVEGEGLHAEEWSVGRVWRSPHVSRTPAGTARDRPERVPSNFQSIGHAHRLSDASDPREVWIGNSSATVKQEPASIDTRTLQRHS